MNMTMTTTSKNTYFSNAVCPVVFSAICLLAVFLLPHTSQADDETYSTHVTLHAYYGESGSDGHGGHTYKVKVAHGHHQYYVYLHTPLPELNHGAHDHAKADVIVSKGSDKWLQLTYQGKSARIHKVAVIHHD